MPGKMRLRYSIIASNAYLASVGHRCGLHRLVATTRIDNSKANVREQGTTVEATWGAIYLDSGYNYELVKSAMERMLATADLLDDRMRGDPAEAGPSDTTIKSPGDNLLDDSIVATATPLRHGTYDTHTAVPGADDPVIKSEAYVHRGERRTNRRNKIRNLDLGRKKEESLLIRVARAAARRMEKTESNARWRRRYAKARKESWPQTAESIELAAST
ncbi:hypothetical protein LTR86_004961 [Recurvomyces mirabilis]|nr:hypothetical protein LTR86_004961 [Recurvomyces mirabilis]